MEFSHALPIKIKSSYVTKPSVNHPSHKNMPCTLRAIFCAAEMFTGSHTEMWQAPLTATITSDKWYSTQRYLYFNNWSCNQWWKWIPSFCFYQIREQRDNQGEQLNSDGHGRPMLPLILEPDNAHAPFQLNFTHLFNFGGQVLLFKIVV